ncbi:acyl-CoA dehydrogenase family protein [Nocardia salmonicida]|uniref:acyl-CoA dehydrogenase family protein n=1 Tax=Nocardia TaxID=1817 RepID=UPI0026582A68|nr:acyl-CoA dehydrogenase family protein [Nocardia sp. PE-7]WKG12550.1 acyl-CoA dehydrogenase family protein [Nocardia sp. PE-7]
MTSTISDTTSSTDRVALAREIGETLRLEVPERDRTGEISVAAFDRLRSSGLSAALVPVEFGGGGASHQEMGQILRELGRHDPSTAVAFAMHSHLVAAQVWRHNHGVDASAVFAKVAGGAILVSTGASDWVESNGQAVRVDGGYRVSARKAPASGCEVGDVLVTSVRYDDEVLHFAIPLAAAGVSIDKTWDSFGLRASGSHTVVLDDVFVPDAAISMTRPAGPWPPVLNVVIGAALPLVLAAYLGVADAAVDLTAHLLAGRSEAHTIQSAGEMLNAYTTAEDLVTAMFTDSENLSFPNSDSYAARTLSRKTVASDALITTVRLAIETTGGAGYSRACDLERLYRDIHGCQFHPLPRAKQTRFSGRVLLGHNPLG